MERSEPTTDEIVKALKCIADAVECKDCQYKYVVGSVILCDHERMNTNAADRLESQQQDIENLNETITGLLATIKDIGKAIDAEKARADAAVADIPPVCIKCANAIFGLEKEPCKSCFNTNDKPNWKWRGEKGKAT